MAIVFRNNGALDLRALTLSGVSVKVKDNPVGFFGTGLKYAMAVLVRTGHKVMIRTDGTIYTISTKKIDFRGTEIDQLYIERAVDGSRTEMPFTLQFGKNWTVEDAFRELWCNTFDEENGEVVQHPDNDNIGVAPHDSTEIWVTGEEIEKVYHDRWHIILNRERLELVHSDANMEVYKAPDPSMCQSVFYRGIRVLKTPEPSRFVYNILEYTTLTENRTLAYTWQVPERIMAAVTHSNSEEVISAVLQSGGHFEKQINFGNVEEFTRTFADTAEILRRSNKLSQNAKALFDSKEYISRSVSYGYEDPTKIHLLVDEQAKVDEVMQLLASNSMLAGTEEVLLTFHVGEDISVSMTRDKKTIQLSRGWLERSVQQIATVVLTQIARRFGEAPNALATLALTGSWPVTEAAVEDDEDDNQS